MPKILPNAPTPTAQVAVATAPPQPPITTTPSIVQAATKPKKEPRPIRFPELMVNGVVIPRNNLRITVANARAMLGYETEAEYKARMNRLYGHAPDRCWFRAPGMATDHKDFAKLANAPEAHFTDPSGQKVICWRNGNNRPLREAWVRELMQDILERGWKLNCENIIVSKTGLVESGQHRLIALVWAALCWGNAAVGDSWSEPKRIGQRHWRDEQPYIESLVACGAEEDVATLMTLDNTLARTDADNYIQVEFFDGWTRKIPTRVDGNKVWVDAPIDSQQKRECSRFLERAVDLLWTRTGATGGSDAKRFKSKKATIDFVNAHPKLLECVQHVWRENGGDNDSVGRPIDGAGLSPGESAGMLYLMGSCRSDAAAYRNKPSVADRNEESLDWSELQRAKEFFSMLAASDPSGDGSADAKALFRPLRHALGMIVDPRHGLKQGGTPQERQALVAKAWAAYITRGNIEETDLSLHYKADVDQEGNQTAKWLDECPTFGGVDVGLPTKGKSLVTSERPPTTAEVETGKKSAKERKREEEQAKAREIEQRRQQHEQQRPTANEQLRQQIAELKAMYPGKVLVLCPPSGYPLRAFGTDAMMLAQCSGHEVNDNVEPCALTVDKGAVPAFLARAAAAHPNTAIVKKETVPAGQLPRYTCTSVQDALAALQQAATA